MEQETIFDDDGEPVVFQRDKSAGTIRIIFVSDKEIVVSLQHFQDIADQVGIRAWRARTAPWRLFLSAHKKASRYCYVAMRAAHRMWSTAISSRC